VSGALPGQDAAHSIAPVREGELGELLPLMRAYCDFYETKPGDESLLALSRALLADPAHEGIQLLARDGEGRACGFATVFWSWDTTEGARIGIMNDLYVEPDARRGGLGRRLIEACREQCLARGATRLDWMTGPHNRRAQALYDRTGAARESWVAYALPVRAG
jgi:GNAT superfamily N-acetyltransferase